MYHYLIGVGVVLIWLALTEPSELSAFCVPYGLITATIGVLLEKKFPKLGIWSLLLTFLITIITPYIVYRALVLLLDIQGPGLPIE